MFLRWPGREEWLYLGSKIKQELEEIKKKENIRNLNNIVWIASPQKRMKEEVSDMGGYEDLQTDLEREFMLYSDMLYIILCY